MKNYWSILEIEPTTNKDKIKEAYYNKLVVVNPEDNEEGFKELRNAYEILLKECDNISKEEDMVDVWLDKLNDLYFSFSKRINENIWKDLLSDDICFSLDTKEEVSSALLEYLMDHCYFPQKIWIILNDVFNWLDNKEELLENFPEGFIYYVESRIKNSDNLNYYLFKNIDDSRNYDEWINTYYKINKMLNEKDLDEVLSNLNKMKSLNIEHPYYNILEMRYMFETEDYDKAEEIGEFLYKDYPNDVKIIYNMAEVKWLSRKFEEALKYYYKVLEILPNNYDALLGIADCNFEMKNYEEAKEMYNKVIKINIYDNYPREQRRAVNDYLIEKYRNELNLDIESRFALAWCLYENFKYSDVLELFNGIDILDDFMEQYYDLMGKTLSCTGEYMQSLTFYRRWLYILEAKEVRDKETDAKLAYCCYQVGRQLSSLNKYEESIKYYDKCLEIDENDYDALNYKAEALRMINKNEESLKVIEKALKIDNSFMNLYINKSKALYNMGFDGEALDAAISAQNIYPYSTSSYILQMKLYLRHSEFDNVLKVYERAKEFEVMDEEIVLYKIKALYGNDKIDEAEKDAIDLIKYISENGDKCNVLSEVYYEYSLMLSDKGTYKEALVAINNAIDISKDINYYYARGYFYISLREYVNALSDYEYILSIKPNDTFSYLKKAEIYKNLQNYEKCKEIYIKVIEIDPKNDSAYADLARIYEDEGNIKKAFEYYNKKLEIEEDSYTFFCRAYLYGKLKEYNKAKEDYKKVIELEPSNSLTYNNLANIYMKEDKYEKAYECLKKAIEYMGDNPFVEFYINIGKCLKKLSRFDEAISIFTKGIELFKYNRSLYYEKSRVYKVQAKYEEAVDVFKEYLKYDLDNDVKADIYNEIGSIYSEAENCDEAIKWYEKILKIDKNHPFIYRKIGVEYYEKKQYDKAKEYILKQITIDKHPYNLIELAEVYNKLNDKNNEIKCYKDALKSYEEESNVNASEYSEMAKCYLKLGEINKAIDFNYKAMKNMCGDCDYRECHEAYYGLGQAYEDKKEYNKALEYYNKAYDIVLNNDDNYKEAIERINKILKMDVNN